MELPTINIFDEQRINDLLASNQFETLYNNLCKDIIDPRFLELPDIERKIAFYLYYTKQEDLISNIQDVVYKKPILGFNEFIDQSPSYRSKIFPYWRRHLTEFYDPTKSYRELLISGCIGPDTKILILDGRRLTIPEIIECLNNGEDLWVFNYNISNNSWEPDRITSAFLSGYKELFKVTLSNGESFTCTSDHQFLTKDNKWVSIDDGLEINSTSLKPYNYYDPNYNHYVVSIESLGFSDVYDINTERNHNFVLESGVIAHNCIGSGKTFIGLLTIIYALYRISCLRFPRSVFPNIGVGSPLAAIVISMNLRTAMDTVMTPLMEELKVSPFFEQVLCEADFQQFRDSDPIPWYLKNGQLNFPNKITVKYGSREQHTTGYTCFAGMFDEAEEQGTLNKSLKLYTSLRERIRSRLLYNRFTSLTVLSSAKSTSGIMWELRKDMSNDEQKRSYYLAPSQWEVKFEKPFEDGYFWCLAGTSTFPSRLLETEADIKAAEEGTYHIPSHCRLIKVPAVFKPDFKNRIEEALRNLAGITTDSSDRPFTDLTNLVEETLVPEFKLRCLLNSDVPLVNQFPTELFQNIGGKNIWKRAPTEPRYIHFDLNSNNKSEGGMCICHPEYIIDPFDPNKKVKIAVVDAVVVLYTTDRINITAIENLMYDLQNDYNANIRIISADQFQSEQFRSNLQSSKLFQDVNYQSIDRYPETYLNLSTQIIKGWVKAGRCDYLKLQLENLLVENRKVICVSQRKDCADAFAGAVNNLFMDANYFPTTEYKTSDTPASKTSIIQNLFGKNISLRKI